MLFQVGETSFLFFLLVFYEFDTVLELGIDHIFGSNWIEFEV